MERERYERKKRNLTIKRVQKTKRDWRDGEWKRF